MIVMATFVLIFLGLSVLVIIHELGHFFSAKWFGLLVEEFGFGIPPRLWGKKIGETLYSVNFLPFGGFVKIFGERHGEEFGGDVSRSFSHQLIWKRFLVIFSGVLMNFLLGWALISAVYIIGIPQSLLITELQERGIAADAGLQKGDQIFGFKGVPEFVNFVNQNKGREVALNIQRRGKELAVKVTPRLNVPEGEGNLGIFLVESGLPKSGFFAAIGRGLNTALGMSGVIFLGILDLIVGVFTDISALERFLGPVGIVNVAVETAKLGAVYFFQLLALISLNLAVFNIFPIPALDGGRLVFLVVEKLKGRPISPKTEMAINGLGFAFLLFLIIAITVRDILTLL